MKRKTRDKYTEDDLCMAIADIKNGKSSYRTAAEKYGIPVSTLCDKIKQRVSLNAKIGKFCPSNIFN